MIWYKKSQEQDPYHELWSREQWLHPIENAERMTFPLVVTAEPTNACQNKCLYCSRQLMKREIGYMTKETMERISREAAAHRAAIRHGGFGEPLMHPEIVDLIAINKKQGALTTIFTNCNLLTEEMVRRFVDLGLDEIRFSSSGISPEEHNAIRRNSDYHADFERKLEMAHNVREKMNAQRPFLTLYTNVIDYGTENFKSNIDNYQKRYMSFADKIDIDLTMFSRVKELDQVQHLYQQQSVHEEHKPCVTLFLKVIVHWNGDVFGCDCAYNHEPDFYLGNLGQKGYSIEEGYRSEKMRDLRAQLSYSMQHDHFSLCRECFSNTTKWQDKTALGDC